MATWANILIGCATASVVHELGHFIAAWLLHVDIYRLAFFGGRPVFKWIFKGKDWPIIEIGWFPWGGYTYAPTVDLRKEYWIVLAGPLANFVISGTFLQYAGGTGLCATVGTVNIIMCISAMLPFGQKDGARLVAIFKQFKKR